MTTDNTTAQAPSRINFAALVTTQPAPLPARQAAMGEVMLQTGGNIQPVDITATLLTDAERDDARAAAAALYPQVRDNRTLRGTWGDEVLEPLNALVSMILRERGRVDYGNIEPFIQEMNDAVDDFRRKHKKSDDSVLAAQLRRIWTATSRLVGELQRLAKDLYQDSLTAERKLDRVAGKIVERKAQLEANVETCALLIDRNEKACDSLIGVIAIMEQVIVMAVEQGNQIKQEMEGLTEGSIARRNKGKELAEVMQLKADYEKRISAFVQRLAIAWTTTPMTEKTQTLSYELAQRLGLLVTLTIPVLKLVVVQLGMLADAERAATSIARIDAATTAAIDQLSGTSIEVTDKVARQIETTALQPDTLMRMMEAVVTVNRNILAAEAYGRQQRAAVAQAVQQGYMAIIGSEEDLQSARLAAFQAARQPLALPPVPVVPEEVERYAAQEGYAS